MSLRRAAAAVVLLAAIAWGATIDVRAGGLDFGCEVVSVDIAGTLTRFPAALQAGADELLAELTSQGLPPGEIAQISADFDTAIVAATAGLASFPRLLPLPLLGAGIEIPLALVVVDGVRLGAAYVDGGVVRSLAALAGFALPDPLLDEEFVLGDEAARFTLRADLAAWSLSVAAVKRVDLWIAALSVSAGLRCAGGAVTLDVDRQVPDDWGDGIDAALAALHLDDVRWTALSGFAAARLEFGLPFLRLYVEGRLVQPLAERVAWWELREAGLAGSVGMVIRF